MPDTLNIRADDSYLDQVRKLIPAEITGAFLAINSLIPFHAELIWVAGFFLLLIPACWAYARCIHDITRKGQLAFISLVAFPVWALAIAVDRIDFLDLATDRRFVVSCLLVFVSLLAPLFFGTAKPTPPPTGVAANEGGMGT